MSDLNLKWLRTFCALAEHRSFAAAAEVLQISQPTVSAHLTALESQVRAQLVWRTTRKVRLTPSGRRFLVHAQRVLDDLADAVLELRDQATLQRGRVVLACMPTLASNIVPAAVAEFCRRYPRISVTVVDRPSKVVEGLVIDGEADVGIGSKPERSASLSYEPLSTDRFVAILPAASRWANTKAVKLTDLAGESLIALAPSPSIRRIVEEKFTDAGLCFEPKFQVARQTTALGMAEAGLGIALIPESGVPRPLTRKLHALPLRPEIVRGYGIICRRGDPLSAPAAELIKVLRRGLKAGVPPPSRGASRRLIGKPDE